MTKQNVHVHGSPLWWCPACADWVENPDEHSLKLDGHEPENWTTAETFEAGVLLAERAKEMGGDHAQLHIYYDDAVQPLVILV